LKKNIIILGCKNYPAFSSDKVISGGMEIYVEEIVKRLEKHFHFTLISGYSRTENSSVNIISVPIIGKSVLQPISLFVISFFIILGKAISGSKFDLINAQTPLAGFIGYLVKKTIKIPYITTVHIYASDPEHTGIFSKIYGIVEKIVLKNSDIIICAGYKLQQHLVTRYNLDASKMTVINPGMNKPQLHGKRAECAELAPLFGKSITLLFLGRLTQEKGLIDLLKAMALLKEKKIVLLIAGNGDLGHFINEFIVKESLENSVKLLGMVQGEKKRMLLENADILIRTSYHEVFPVAYLEAIAYGMPVIATPAGDTELIANRTGAIHIVPMNDPQTVAQTILKLAESPKLDQKTISRSINFIQEISWDKQAEKTLTEFNKLIYHQKDLND
jgi:glycosyltransferase involved in cell wall biosynthesis